MKSSLLHKWHHDRLGSRNKEGASQGAQFVKNPPANAGDTADMGSIPGREDPLEKEMATHSSILAWRSSWTEEPGGLQSMGLRKESDTT